MTGTGLLLPIDARRVAATMLASGVATALGCAAATPVARRPDAAWLLAQAVGGDATARRRAADQALRILQSRADVAMARRVAPRAIRADVRAATGAALPPDAALPEMVEARLAPGSDPVRVRSALARLPGLATAIEPPDRPMRWATSAACLMAVTAAAGTIATAAAIAARSRREALAILHRLGAPRSRLVVEAALPAIASAATGIAAGAAVAAWLPAGTGPDGSGAPVMVPLGFLLVALPAACGSALRRIGALR